MTLGLTAPQLLAVTTAALACATDVTSRRIPNVLTFGAAALAVVYGGFTGGWNGIGLSVAGWMVGLLVFFPLFLLRGLGGGDVKLMAALGAWLGPYPTLWVAAFAAIAGGPLAVIVASSRGYLRQALRNVWGLLTYWRVMGLKPHPAMTLQTSKAPRLPYALPIFLGLVVTLWLR